MSTSMSILKIKTYPHTVVFCQVK